MGNNDEIFRMADGSIWQVKYAYEYLYAYSPDVIICPEKSRLIIEGKQIEVALVSQNTSKKAGGNTRSTKRKNHQVAGAEQEESDGSDKATASDNAGLIETQIDGTFSGWDGETIFKLSNGQIWQQSAYAYTYRYAYRPKVLIFKTDGGYQMQVEGVDQRVRVKRLK